MPAHATIQRLLRRTIRSLLSAVLLIVIYFAQYFASFWLLGTSKFWTRPVNFGRDTVFFPIEWLAHTPLPISPYVEATADWCYYRGQGKQIPWSEVYDYCDGIRTGWPVSRPTPKSAPTQ